MSTLTFAFSTTASIVAALRRSWLVSAAEGVAAAFRVVFLDDAGPDPEMGVRR